METKNKLIELIESLTENQMIFLLHLAERIFNPCLKEKEGEHIP